MRDGGMGDGGVVPRAQHVERDRLLARAREWLGAGAGALAAGDSGGASGAGVAGARTRVFGVAGSPVPPAVAGLGSCPQPADAGPQPDTDPGVAVVLVPAAVPLGADELDLLASAAVPPAGALFVVAGRVLGDPLRAAVARHRAVLAEFAPGFERCPFVAGAAPERDLRAALGPARERLARTDVELERAACVVAAEVARRRRGAQRAADEARRRAGDARRRRADAADRRSRLRSQGGAPARMTQLRTDLSRVRMELNHEVGGRCRQAAAAVREELERADRAGVRGFPRRLRRRLADVDAELAARADDTVAAALPASGGGSGSVQGGRGGQPAPDGSDVGHSRSGANCPAPSGRGVPDGYGPPARPRATEDRLMILMGASGGLGVGRVVVSMPFVSGVFDGAWAWFAWPATLLLGGLVAWWIVRARAHLGDRARTRQWANEQIAEFRAGWEQYVARRMLEVEARGVRRIGAEHADDTHALDREIARLDARIAADGRAAERLARRSEDDAAAGEQLCERLRAMCGASHR